MFRKLRWTAMLVAGIALGASWETKLHPLWIRWRESTKSTRQTVTADGASATSGTPRSATIPYGQELVTVPRFAAGIRAVRWLGHRNSPPSIAIYEHPESNVELATQGLPTARPLTRVRLFDDVTPDAVWPLLEEQTLHASGETYAVVKVRVPQPMRESATRSVLPLGQRIDLVLVIDNTYSSDILKTAVQREAMKLLDGLGSDHDVAIGVVLYRDYADGIFYGANREVTKLLNRGRWLRHRDELLDALRTITPALYGSDDFPEAAFDGIHVALQHIPWRAESRRFVIWVGDSSSHRENSPRNPFHLTVKKLSRLARELDARILPVVVEGAGGPDEQALHRRQAEELAAQTDGAVLEFDDLPRLSSRLLSQNEPLSGRSVSTPTEFLSGWTLLNQEGLTLFERGWLIPRDAIEFLRTELSGLAAHLRVNANADFRPTVATNDALTDSLFFSQPHTETWTAMLRRAGLTITDARLNRTQREFLSLSSEAQHELAEQIEQQWLTPLSERLAADARSEVAVWIPDSLLP